MVLFVVVQSFVLFLFSSFFPLLFLNDHHIVHPQSTVLCMLHLHLSVYRAVCLDAAAAAAAATVDSIASLFHDNIADRLLPHT